MSTRTTDIGQREDLRVEQGQKWVRGYAGGELVVDSRKPLLVWERPAYPAYYFPIADVDMDLLEAETVTDGDGQRFTLRAGGRMVPRAGVQYDESPVELLRDAIRFEWDALDAWFEEDEQVHVHPRSPYTRIDALPSSRHVVVEVDGEVVADSMKPTLLFETGLPIRYYLPKTDVHMDMLVPTDTVTHCPYKGQAEYWTVRTPKREHRDLVWSYPAPLPESQRIISMVCFYNDRVDLIIDGVRQPRGS
jgi:uncharacterized protein (DUF427 family)